jgi:ADP-ribose pyrophosphatase YjhB (NUDIX family)
MLESGALAYRRLKNGRPLILLVSKKRSKKWGIPKGKLNASLSFGETAAKEAFEEAGVMGRVSPNSIGMFRAKKGTPTPKNIEVWVYLLEVDETLSNWPEKDKRKTRWVSCKVAARELREPVLTHLCRRLAQSEGRISPATLIARSRLADLFLIRHHEVRRSAVPGQQQDPGDRIKARRDDQLGPVPNRCLDPAASDSSRRDC